MAWEAIIEEWNGNITKEAIAEAVQLATQALLKHADDFILGQENLERMQRALGDRLTVFPSGGHLGNLYLPPVQEGIFGALDGER